VRSRIGSVAMSIVREPTFHFLVLAGLLFAVNAALDSRSPEVLELDRGELAARIFQMEASTGSPLTDGERKQLEEEFIDEQLLVLEAKKLGLDRDTRIHDILAQKMLHVLSADVIQPDDTELRAFYEGNLDRYGPEPALTVDELVFAVDGSLPPATLAKLERGDPPERFAEEGPVVHKVLTDVTRDNLVLILDVGFANALFTADEGTWVGPHRTVRGQHWFRSTALSEGVPPPFDVVRDVVRQDWITQEESRRLQAEVVGLRGRYSVRWIGSEVTR